MPIGIILVLLAAGGLYVWAEGGNTGPSYPEPNLPDDMKNLYVAAMSDRLDAQAVAVATAILTVKYPGQYAPTFKTLAARVEYLKQHPEIGTH